MSPGSASTGKWTDAEHKLFLQGIEENGRRWPKVSALVGTRTTAQVRSHAQKYFQKLGGKPGDKKGDEEDDDGASPAKAAKAAAGKAKA